MEFPKPKEIDYTKYIEPKKVVFVTKNGITTANLVTIKNK
jgi:hypothetical protein